MDPNKGIISPVPRIGNAAPLCPAPLRASGPPDAEPPPLQMQTPPASLQQPAPPGSESCLPTPEQIFQNIKQEYNRYQRWRHLEVVLSQSEAYTSESQPSSSALTAPGSPGAFWMKKGQPTFTLRQVGLMCERLLKYYEIKSERSMSRPSVPNSQVYPEAFLPIWYQV